MAEDEEHYSEVDKIIENLHWYRPCGGFGLDYYDLKVDFIKKRISRDYVLRKVTDTVLKVFEGSNQLFEDDLIVQLRKQHQPDLLFPWLHNENRLMVEENLKCALNEIDKYASTEEFGFAEKDYRHVVIHLQKRAAQIKAQNEISINHLVHRRDSVNDELTLTANRTDNVFFRGDAGPKPLIFISHSSRDRGLAGELVELLRSAMNIPASEIRCTSVDGYRLPAGAHQETQLREEVLAAQIFLGLLTPASIGSTYVLFELGARWGAQRHLLPLLAGISSNSLSGPVAALNALNLQSESQVHQLIEEIAHILKKSLQSVSSYNGKIANIAKLTRTSFERTIGEA